MRISKEGWRDSGRNLPNTVGRTSLFAKAIIERYGQGTNYVFDPASMIYLLPTRPEETEEEKKNPTEERAREYVIREKEILKLVTQKEKSKEFLTRVSESAVMPSGRELLRQKSFKQQLEQSVLAFINEHREFVEQQLSEIKVVEEKAVFQKELEHLTTTLELWKQAAESRKPVYQKQLEQSIRKLQEVRQKLDKEVYQKKLQQFFLREIENRHWKQEVSRELHYLAGNSIKNMSAEERQELYQELKEIKRRQEEKELLYQKLVNETFNQEEEQTILQKLRTYESLEQTYIVGEEKTYFAKMQKMCLNEIENNTLTKYYENIREQYADIENSKETQEVFAVHLEKLLLEAIEQETFMEWEKRVSREVKEAEQSFEKERNSEIRKNFERNLDSEKDKRFEISQKLEADRELKYLVKNTITELSVEEREKLYRELIEIKHIQEKKEQLYQRLLRGNFTQEEEREVIEKLRQYDVLEKRSISETEEISYLEKLEMMCLQELEKNTKEDIILKNEIAIKETAIEETAIEKTAVKETETVEKYYKNILTQYEDLKTSKETQEVFAVHLRKLLLETIEQETFMEWKNSVSREADRELNYLVKNTITELSVEEREKLYQELVQIKRVEEKKEQLHQRLLRENFTQEEEREVVERLREYEISEKRNIFGKRSISETEEISYLEKLEMMCLQELEKNTKADILLRNETAIKETEIKETAIEKTIIEKTTIEENAIEENETVEKHYENILTQYEDLKTSKETQEVFAVHLKKLLLETIEQETFMEWEKRVSLEADRELKYLVRTSLAELSVEEREKLYQELIEIKHIQEEKEQLYQSLLRESFTQEEERKVVEQLRKYEISEKRNIFGKRSISETEEISYLEKLEMMCLQELEKNTKSDIILRNKTAIEETAIEETAVKETVIKETETVEKHYENILKQYENLKTSKETQEVFAVHLKKLLLETIEQETFMEWENRVSLEADRELKYLVRTSLAELSVEEREKLYQELIEIKHIQEEKEQLYQSLLRESFTQEEERKVVERLREYEISEKKNISEKRSISETEEISYLEKLEMMCLQELEKNTKADIILRNENAIEENAIKETSIKETETVEKYYENILTQYEDLKTSKETQEVFAVHLKKLLLETIEQETFMEWEKRVSREVKETEQSLEKERNSEIRKKFERNLYSEKNKRFEISQKLEADRELKYLIRTGLTELSIEEREKLYQELIEIKHIQEEKEQLYQRLLRESFTQEEERKVVERLREYEISEKRNIFGKRSISETEGISYLKKLEMMCLQELEKNIKADIILRNKTVIEETAKKEISKKETSIKETSIKETETVEKHYENILKQYEDLETSKETQEVFAAHLKKILLETIEQEAFTEWENRASREADRELNYLVKNTITELSVEEREKLYQELMQIKHVEEEKEQLYQRLLRESFTQEEEREVIEKLRKYEVSEKSKNETIERHYKNIRSLYVDLKNNNETQEQVTILLKEIFLEMLKQETKVTKEIKTDTVRVLQQELLKQNIVLEEKQTVPSWERELIQNEVQQTIWNEKETTERFYHNRSQIEKIEKFRSEQREQLRSLQETSRRQEEQIEKIAVQQKELKEQVEKNTPNPYEQEKRVLQKLENQLRLERVRRGLP